MIKSYLRNNFPLLSDFIRQSSSQPKKVQDMWLTQVSGQDKEAITRPFFNFLQNGFRIRGPLGSPYPNPTLKPLTHNLRPDLKRVQDKPLTWVSGRDEDAITWPFLIFRPNEKHFTKAVLCKEQFLFTVRLDPTIFVPNFLNPKGPG